MSDLNSRLLEAHDRGDTAALVTLYMQAANQAKDQNAAGFFMTQAYVFALDTNDARLQDLRNWLVANGREA
ncbi:hypothetical protein [Falsiphaeobacter marinintestinus]|uniref:hypothetical protein n=1 Tax=Falsiphaeobacter marinintestinus TaxID=1492905 RepID=UPI0011B59B55|nr:hypothetical protein [Phaeobacter marinintestinus]